MTKRIYFFKIGSFSHINAHVEALVVAGFPKHEVIVLDVLKDLIMKRPLLVLHALCQTIISYPFQIFFRRTDPRNFFCRTPVVFRFIKKWVSTNINLDSCLFTFQTQSLFDASHPQVAHFIYTDHTYLAKLRYTKKNTDISIDQNWLKREKCVYPAARRCFTTSQFCRTSIIEDYQIEPSRVVCVYSGINTNEQVVATEKKVWNNRILFVGVEWERKGGPDLLSAFRRVQAEIPKSELWIVGCKPKVKRGCKAFGRVDLNQVPEFYRQADIFCLPSYYEPSATVLSEAASFRLPIVATNVGGTSDRVLDGKTGYLISPDDIDALADALLRLLRDPEKSREMGRNGAALVESSFRWPVVGRALVSQIQVTL